MVKKSAFRKSLHDMLRGAYGGEFTPDDMMTVVDLCGLDTFCRWLDAVFWTYFNDNPEKFSLSDLPRYDKPFNEIVDLLWKDYDTAC